jgi:phosphatidylglycerophosphatase A
MIGGMPADAAVRRSPLDLAATVVATGLGSGFSPVAPGTAGSLVGLVLFWPMREASPPVQVAAILVGFVVGVYASTIVARNLGRKDPGLVVWDEVVGMWTTLALLPFTPFTALAGFLLFRVMDVVKPWPARQLEDLPDGWGIMADDLFAGIYAHLALRAVLLVWPA